MRRSNRSARASPTSRDQEREDQVLPLTSKVAIALGIHLAEQEKIREVVGDSYQSDYALVVCQPDGSPIRPSASSSSIVAEMKTLSKRVPSLKKKHVSHHGLRHAYATGRSLRGRDDDGGPRPLV